jgi:hypothetical protein
VTYTWRCPFPSSLQSNYTSLNVSDYEKRFQQRNYLSENLKNVAGYGGNSLYIPPLYNHKNLITEWDKIIHLLFMSHELQYLWGYFVYTGEGDGIDGAWYNNAEAIGHQLAPTGIHKYYDMYSWAGYWTYSYDKFFAILYIILSPFTLFVPLNFWIAIF